MARHQEYDNVFDIRGHASKRSLAPVEFSKLKKGLIIFGLASVAATGANVVYRAVEHMPLTSAIEDASITAVSAVGCVAVAHGLEKRHQHDL